MKIMDKASVDSRVIGAEREVMEKVCNIDSKFLVKLQYAFQSDSRVFLVMEYYGGGSLTELERSQGGRLPKDMSRRLAAQLSCGLRDLHAHKIIHRDLKPENVLLTSKGFAVLADFGLSTLCPRTVSNAGPATAKAGFAGTVEYAAPERLQKNGSIVTSGVDWWAFGAIVFEALCGRTPFAADTARDLFINVLFKDPAFRHDFDEDPFAKDLLEGLLLKDTKARLCPWDDQAFDRFRGHSFFNGDFDKHSATPLIDTVDADLAKFDTFDVDAAPKCSVQDLTDKYFVHNDDGTTSAATLKGFEFAACVKMDEEDEPLIVGTIDGEEVRESHVKRPPTSTSTKAFLFCGCLDKTSKDPTLKPISYSTTSTTTGSHDHRADSLDDGTKEDHKTLLDFDDAFNDADAEDGDVRGNDPPESARDSGGLAEFINPRLSDMMFFVCYDQKADAASA